MSTLNLNDKKNYMNILENVNIFYLIIIIITKDFNLKRYL